MILDASHIIRKENSGTRRTYTDELKDKAHALLKKGAGSYAVAKKLNLPKKAVKAWSDALAREQRY